MKAAVYAGTRNVYEDMLPSIKSLLINSDVEKIYMLIEDDIFPYELPPECETINVSRQRWIPQNSVNYSTRWSYMILLRACYTKLFPDLDRILSMDNDTLVLSDISELWDIDLDDYYFAAVKEPWKSEELGYLYTCVGVSMYNLDLLRRTGMDELFIREVTRSRHMFPEQDAFNELSQGHVLELPAEYGMSPWTTQCKYPKIEHYAASEGAWRDYELVNYYRNIPFSEIRKEKQNG